MSLAAHMADVVVLHRRALDVAVAASAATASAASAASTVSNAGAAGEVNPNDDELVHDTRVALRRCRSLAHGLAAIDLENRGAWRAMSAQAKVFFDGLGALRDAQVMVEHASRLLGSGHEGLLAFLRAPLGRLIAEANDVTAAFDVVAWQARAATLPPLAERALRRHPVLLHLALVRFDEARALHVLAMRHRTQQSLHDTRIGVKRLRYTLESLLPEVHREVAKPLKRMQELLGDLHDLDVLIDAIRASGEPEIEPAVAKVALARGDLLARYRALAVGRSGAWADVRAALPGDAVVVERCRCAFLREVARAAGLSDRDIRRNERVAFVIAGLEGRRLSAAERHAALLGGLRRRRQKWAIGHLLGFPEPETSAIRSALCSPVGRALQALTR